MPSSSTSSTPISIPIAINNSRRSSSSSDDDYGDGNDIGGRHRTALNASDVLAEQRVGSLPMHLRRPGRNTYSISDGMRQYHRNNGSLSQQQQQFMGPMSLPPPRAPFLSARQDMDNRLSTMPEMILPESADLDLSSSVPFGSLRDSKFAHPRYDLWQQQSSSRGNNYQATTQFQPQSLPAYSGGIGAFFPESNYVGTENKKLNESSGIGGLLEGSQEGGNNNVSCDIIAVTEECSHLSLETAGIGPMHTTNDENLSRSFTALDMMTRIRETTPSVAAAPPPPLSQLERLESNVEYHPSMITGVMMDQSDFYQQREQQQQLQYLESQTPTENTGGSNEQDDHPDTFEAFDFELD